MPINNQLILSELKFRSEYLDDIEQIRIATGNRISAMERSQLDVTPYIPQLAAFEKLEKEAVKALEKTLRHHPLHEWIKTTIGIGEKQGARLIASIGVISYNQAHDRPRRGPAELWAYCGYVPGQRPKKGIRSNWNPVAKSRAYLCAESCMKQMESPYRADYDNARCKYEDAVHDQPCPQCGPKGKAATIGSPLKDGHKQARALRYAAKMILKDMFLEAQRFGV